MYKGEKKGRWVLATVFNPQNDNHPANTLLATAGDGEYIFVWEVKTGKCMYKLKADSTSKIWSLAFSPDGRFIAGAGNDQKVRIWDLQTKECVQRFDDICTVQPSSLAFMSNGNIVTQANVHGSEAVVTINSQTGDYLEDFKNPRPYEGLTISNVKGLNQSQKECLKALGAIE